MIRLRAATGILLLGALLVPAVPGTQEPPSSEPPPPWEISRQRPGEPAWGPALRLRPLEENYRDTPYWGSYAQLLAHAEASLGNHLAALRAFDLPYPPRDSVGVLPPGTRAVNAVARIGALADTARVIMVNERHHATNSRLLTLELLAPLREKGFTHLAAEALDAADTALNERGFPVESTGFYTREPVFAALLREAHALGYTIVPYESMGEPSGEDAELTHQQFRDLEQARNLKRVLDHEPGARILVHAGYQHILETPSERWHPMAAYFRELTGIDPVTVDQTVFCERGDETHEHPLYRAAVAAGLVADHPVILVDAEGALLEVSPRAVDLQVFTPRTSYLDGREAWRRLGGRRVPFPVAVPEAGFDRRFVKAWAFGESGEGIPLDLCEVAGVPEVTLFLPPGGVTLEIFDEAGRLLGTTLYVVE